MPNPALPPGARWAPIQSLRYMRDAYGYTERMRRRHGDPFTMPSMNGTLVLTTSSEGARQILEGREEDFVVGFGVDALAPLLGAGSLLLQSGEPHRRERKLLSPTFHGARMRAYAPLVCDVTRRELGAWRAGMAFSAQESMQSIGLDVIIRAVLGAQSPERVAAFREAIRMGVNELSPAPLFFSALQREFGGFGPWARFQRLKRVFDALIFEQIAEARELESDREDVLSKLVRARYDDGAPLSDQALRDQIMTLLVAGHETTATALAWSLYELVRHPEWRERLRDSIAALGPDPDPAELAKLPELDAFNRETLRLHPIVAEFFRTVKDRFTLLGWEIPAGISLAASILMLHRDPELYPEPLAFRPERFLERRFAPWEFLAFGGSHRHCIGAAFAMSEMNVVLGTLVPRVELRLAEDRELRTVRRSLLLAPEQGVPLVVERVFEKPAATAA